ncbi:MAG TPA: CBS domain-containing protein [Gemmatimonadales bacterium]
MKLLDLLAGERVLIPLAADTVASATDRLTSAVAASGVATDVTALEQMAAELQPSEAVTVSQQAYLLHFRTDAVRQLTAALGVTKKAIERDEDSGKAARIVVLLIAPHKDSSAYLQALSAFARAMGRPEVVKGLLAAKKPADVLELLPLVDVTLPGYLTVRDVLGPRLLSVKPESTLDEAVSLMVAHSAPALVVVGEQGDVLGVVTHREVLKFLLPGYVKKVNTGEFPPVGRKAQRTQRDPGRVLVKDAMNRSVLCLSEDQTLGDVASMMVNKDVEHFPVVRDGALVGILSRGDIVRRLFGS